MKESDIRKKFKDFFEKRSHKWYSSMSIVPPDDPSMLFTTAGMVQFKKQFLGEAGKLTRTASIQKCLRTSDIDEVGKTARHLTFFEMYGNFSFGDYFKEEAIQWSWDFLIGELNLPVENIYATVYKDDDEAFEIWKKYLPEERIVRLGDKDNFWTMGETGPCGPCSEIIYDQGPEKGCSNKDCKVGCECDRYLEVWNLVFTQYDRQKDGTLSELPKKNIDTGMGLERLHQVLGRKDNVYETFVLKSIMDDIEKNTENFNLSSARIISDHIRAVTFMIGDGVSPSNEGRGYVLRRLIRRASRECRKIGWNEPRLWKYTSVIIDLMGEYYPEIIERATHIATVCKMEEENFVNTLDSAMRILDDFIADMEKSKEKILPAEKAFKLYDTYGLPVDITRNILQEKDLSVDEDGFNSMMEERARSSKWKEKEGTNTYWDDIKELSKTENLAYEDYSSKARVLKIINSGEAIVLDRTSMYAESGGQIGDTGEIKGKNGNFKVKNTVKEENVVIHEGLLEGKMKEGDDVEVKVDVLRRKAIERNHSATHLVQSVLREELGSHVQQNGSLVEPERLRFDFTHTESVTHDQLEKIESKVNAIVMSNIPVNSMEMSRGEAKDKGALAFFGEKYGDRVRTVIVDDPVTNKTVSMELCGGTHLKNTGEVGLFKIVSESGIAAGVRRIEAVTGSEALRYIQEKENKIKTIAELINASDDKLIDKVKKLQKELKEKDKKIRSLENKMVSGVAKESKAEDEGLLGGFYFVHEFDDVNVQLMRSWADNVLASQIPKTGIEGMAALAIGKTADKVTLILKLDKKLAEKYDAKLIISEAAKKINGSGGGRRDMAQGGGTDINGIGEAKKVVEEFLSGRRP